MGCRVSPPFLDHCSAPPLAWCIALSYTLARGPIFGAHFTQNSPPLAARAGGCADGFHDWLQMSLIASNDDGYDALIFPH